MGMDGCLVGHEHTAVAPRKKKSILQGTYWTFHEAPGRRFMGHQRAVKVGINWAPR